MNLLRPAMPPIVPLAGVALLASAQPSLAAQAQFLDLGTLLQIPGVTVNSDAFDLSYDGRTVVGLSFDLVGGVGRELAFRWREGIGMEALGYPSGGSSSKAFRVSPDGSRVGGSYRQGSSSVPYAFTWSRSAGSTDFLPIGFGISLAEPIVALGNAESFVVGTSLVGAIRWTRSGGSTVIPPLPGYTDLLLDGASRDGRSVAGSAVSNLGQSRAVVWREGAGLTVLPTLAGFPNSRATGISGDGTTVIGYGRDAAGVAHRAFAWTETGGLADLGDGVPADVSDDGATIVFGGSPARIWTAAAGVQDLRTLLTAGGAIVPPRPFEVRAVSGDGRMVAGWVQTPILGTTRHAFLARLSYGAPGPIGTSYCASAVPNSTGQPATIHAFGSIVLTDGSCTLFADRLPQHVLGYFLNSRTQGFVANPAGSSGNLCLGGAIGRFYQSAQSSGALGAIGAAVDVMRVPVPSGYLVIASGETWNFQAWYRDGASSNFSDAIAIMFE